MWMLYQNTYKREECRKKSIILFLLFLPVLIFAQQSFNTPDTPNIVCNNSFIKDAYNLALNTVYGNVHDGVLAAGGDYGGEWTRDISINSWNGVSLLSPEVAKKSLWSVTNDKNTIGHQYWDQIIWAIAALDYYRSTNDSAFLRQAYICSVNTMTILEKTVFDSQYGLFTGPSVFNDGIAGYPEPVYKISNGSTYVLDYENAKTIKCLSTNCLYYGAYKSLIEMGKLLKVDDQKIQIYKEKAKKLRANIRSNLYSETENKLYYLIDNTGNIAKYQEGLGVSFAIIWGVLDKKEATKILQNVTIGSEYGITSIYPDFPRFSAEKPGRHNNIIWPMVNGFFAQAAIVAGDTVSYVKELIGLTHLALDEDKGKNEFWEIYNPYSGEPDGGWQVGFHSKSCRRQTWSATAYINMVLYGLIGFRLQNDGIIFSPYLPHGINNLEIKKIKYQRAVLDIQIKGTGSKIKSFLLNGKSKSSYRIESTIQGSNKIEIELGLQ